MDRRKQPIGGRLAQPMLHRIGPAIPDVIVVVPLVADVVFVEPALPDAGILLGYFARTSGLPQSLRFGGLETHPTVCR